jgi:hypothetical protein
MLALASPAYAEDYSLRPLGAIPSPLMDTYQSYSDIAPVQTTAGYPEEYTWPTLLPEALDQGPYPECVAYALRATKDMLALSYGLPESHSAGFIYANRLLLGDWSQEGMMVQQAFLNLKNNGVCLDATFPACGTYTDLKKLITPAMRQEAQGHKIADYARINKDDEIKACLINTSPVPITVPIYDKFYDTGADGILIMPDTSGPTNGCHEMVICGWRLIGGVPYWYVLNSWGVAWGSYGYCYMPMGYPILERWAVVDAESPPLPEPEIFINHISFTLEVTSQNVCNPVFQWWLRDLQGNWACVRDYSTEDSITLSDLPAGDYEAVVYCKEQAASWETATWQVLENRLYLH